MGMYVEYACANISISVCKVCMSTQYFCLLSISVCLLCMSVKYAGLLRMYSMYIEITVSVYCVTAVEFVNLVDMFFCLVCLSGLCLSFGYVIMNIGFLSVCPVL
jgi:hypothetical protein